MAISGYFFNAVKSGGVYDRTYNAEDVTSYLDKIVGSGVFPNPSTQLQVTAGTGMKVVASAGQGWINGHKLINSNGYEMTVDTADALLPRIDRVVFYADFTNRLMGIKLVKGTAAASPTAPALIRTDEEYQMSLATVLVAAGTSSISQSAITDTRPDSTVCGWVQGLIQQVDTSTLYTQWETAYSEFYDQMRTWMAAEQAAFESWLSTLTQELTVGAYLHGFEKHTMYPAGATMPASSIPLNMDGYEYAEDDVIMVWLNGLYARPGTDYTVTEGEQWASVNLGALGTLSNNFMIDIRVIKTIIGPPPAGGTQVNALTIRNIIRSDTEIEGSGALSE